jgi:hypothetical protein
MKALLRVFKSYRTTYTMRSQEHGEVTFTVSRCVPLPQGTARQARHRTSGLCRHRRLALAAYPIAGWLPQEVWRRDILPFDEPGASADNKPGTQPTLALCGPGLSACQSVDLLEMAIPTPWTASISQAVAPCQARHVPESRGRGYPRRQTICSATTCGFRLAYWDLLNLANWLGARQ